MSKAAPAIVISSEIKGDLSAQMGTAHYSYGVVAERFRGAFERLGYRTYAVQMPEKFKRRADIEIGLGISPDEPAPVHIAFRAPENLRPMPAAEVNICHFAWEFDVLGDRTLISDAVTANQKHMLGLMDAVWTPCGYTRATLLRYGLNPVEIVPTPVLRNGAAAQIPWEGAIGRIAAAPLAYSSGVTRAISAATAAGTIDALAYFPALRRALDGYGQIFLTVCNPHDLRKNLLNAIDGFLYAATEDDVYILKLVLPAGGAFLDDSLHEHLARRYRGPVALSAPNVLVIAEYLNGDQMAALYGMADFYLSASHCEGFNLPLLEAMAHGAVAVTTRNTAMLDYIDAENAVVIRERLFPGAVPGMTSDATGLSAVISVADRFDIARAIRAAKEMSAEARASMADAARRIVSERYSEAAAARIAVERMHEAILRKEAGRDAV